MRIEKIGSATLYLGDCREILPTIGHVDAIVTDPPFGIGFAAQPTKWQRQAGRIAKDWDDNRPSRTTFERMIECCSGDMIIWGGNYFADYLPPSRGWLSWLKPDAPPSMGHFELAWTSLDRTTRQLSCSISSTNPERVGHPTQKPLRLMEWCLGLIPAAKTICDPFMGSGTTGIAAIRAGRNFIGIERESQYFEIACNRLRGAEMQANMFGDEALPPPIMEQTSIFG